MARKRYQNGRVFLKGKKEEKWVGRYREDVVEVTGTTKRVRRSVILGTKRDLPTKRLAERRMATILACINCLDYRPGRAATFGEFIERWETEVLTTQKPSSARAVRSHLRCYIIPEIGKLRLDEFGVENQQRFITRMPERSTEKIVSRKTILNVIATISTILATARNWGYSCEQIDMKKLRLPSRGVASEARHFTIEQVQRILASDGEPWRTLFCICTLDGLRAGEALGLQWGDIDLERRILQIRRTAWYGKTQTPKSRESETTLPIPDALVTILKNYRTEWKHSCSSPGTNGHPHPITSWSTAFGRFSTRSRFHGAASTHFATLTLRCCLTREQRRKSFSDNFATPMLARRYRFTGTS